MFSFAGHPGKRQRAWRAVALCLLTGLSATQASADILSWDTRPSSVFSSGQTDTAMVNGVTIVSSGSASGSFNSRDHQLWPAGSSNGITGYVGSFMDASGDDESSFQTTQILFSEPVYNVSFTVADIDGGASYNDGINRFTDIVELRANAGATLPTSASVVNSSRVSWNASTGRATAIHDNNLTDNSGTIAVTFAGPVTSLAIKHIAGLISASNNPSTQAIFISDISYQRSPRLALQKTTAGAVGTFSYSISNGPVGTISTSLTTAAAGTPVTGALNRLGAAGTATTVTETTASGWVIASTAANCSDANSAESGNPTSFTVSFSGSAYTIPAAHIRGGAELTCGITNTRLPTLTLTKVSIGGAGGFTFSGDNGWSSQMITTTVEGSAVTGATQILTAASTATTITETIPPGWQLLSVSCTGTGGGTQPTVDASSGSIAFTPMQTASGAAIDCTVTNFLPLPRLSLVKTASPPGPVSVGDVITYFYDVANTGNVSLSNVKLGELFNGHGTVPVPGRETLHVDAAPSGDSSNGTSDDGVWQSLGPGDVVRFIAQYRVVQSDIDYLQ
jgi:uncharacterized repeat protein (TIGR01451 family)